MMTSTTTTTENAMTKLRKLIEGLEAIEKVSPNAEPWAYHKNITVSPIDAPDGSELAVLLKRLGWLRASNELGVENGWEFYTPG